MGVIVFVIVCLYSYTTTSAQATLNDRTRFRYFFRTFPSLDHIAPAILQIFKKFEWKKLAFITQKENLYEKVNSYTIVLLLFTVYNM